MQTFTYSGHETFSLRISWLPKAVIALEGGNNPFTDLRSGMEILGLGKNMVRSLAFWVVASGLARKRADGLELTDFARASLSRSTGGDPYLENPSTLWLIHWNLCRGWREANNQRRLPFAWYYFSNLLSSDEITASDALEYFRTNTNSTGKVLSEVTLRQHFDIFIKTYVTSRSATKRSTPEDALDSPLTSIGLLHRAGDRRLSDGRREEVFRINHSAKSTLSLEVVRYCLHQWWEDQHQDEQSASLQEIALGGGCIGRVSCQPEIEVHQQIRKLVSKYPNEFELRESRSQRFLYRLKSVKTRKLLRQIYA